jgi:dUTP pyrophosphatase
MALLTLQLCPCVSALGDKAVPCSTLVDLYQVRAAAHNNMVLTGSHPDSGFDIILPHSEETTVPPQTWSFKVPLGVKCAMQGPNPRGFYLYPRSSTGSKTPLRLSNSVGIIDAGYRGELMGLFDNASAGSVTLEPRQRLVQVCAGDLSPFLVEVVTDETKLSVTHRGGDGLGSTGT